LNDDRLTENQQIEGRTILTITGEFDMSDITMMQARTVEKDLNERIADLTEWLRRASQEGVAQAEIDEGTTERLCWHYGYLIALRDVRELLAAA
jgi:hypothetical protein